MKAETQQRKSRVYHSLLKSYIIVLLIPVFLFVIGSGCYLQLLNAQIASTNEAALSTLASLMDVQMNILYSTTSTLLVDTPTLRLARRDSVDAQRDYDDISDLHTKIVNYVLHSEYIADICLYFPRTDLWLCKDGIIRSTQGFQYYLSKNLPIGIDVWEESLHFNGNKSERLFDAGGQQQLLLYHKYTNTRAAESLPDVLAVMRVDVNALQPILVAFNASGTAAFRILDTNGGMIAALMFASAAGIRL